MTLVENCCEETKGFACRAEVLLREGCVEQGECATRKDAATLVTDSFEGDELDGDTIEIVQQKLRSEGELVYSATLRELLQETIDDPWADEEEIDEARELLETLSDEELDAEAIHWRDFAACGKDFGIDAIFLVEDGLSSLVLYLTPDDYL